jgi:isocitrate lyase
LAYAPYADLIWWRPARRTWTTRKRFAEAIHRRIPRQDAGLQLLAQLQLEEEPGRWTTIAKFQRELGAMGYKFQFVTLAGFHSLNLSMCSSSPRGYEVGRTAAWAPRAPNCKFAGGACFAGRIRAPEPKATPPPATSAKWAWDTST